MPLVQKTIENDVRAAFAAVMNDQSDDRDGALDKVAENLAIAIQNAIKSATITYTTGLIAPPTGGPVTGTFQGKLQ